jgi:hypothetical protein
MHRERAVECQRRRGPGDAPNKTGKCKSDADCTAGKNGRCVSFYGEGRVPPFNQCSYDACFLDGDCGAGSLCVCGHDAGKETGDGHVCVPASCRTDKDCGPAGFCSPSSALCSRGSLPHYYCHTPSDECVNDEDCPKPAKEGYGTTPTGRRYSPEAGHFTCVTEECPVG